MEKCTVLIVDDLPENIDLARNILSEKYNLKVALNGVTALNIVSKSSIDLILLDIMMPEMDGYEVCLTLKSNYKTRDIPIIFLTGKTETEDIVKAFNLGAIDYVTKPFNPPELIARVNTQIMIKQQRKEIIKKNFQLKEMLHIITHDLSNHFSILSMGVEFLRKGLKITDFIKDALGNAITNGIDLINMVREMESLEEKGIEINKINLLDSINKSHSLLSEKLSKKNISLEIDVNPSLNIQAEKRSFINSVVNNLISNAIKFSHDDSKISINACEDEGRILLKIRDNGIGIPQKLLNDLFDAHKSTNRLGTKGEKGTGFGMPIVKKFMDRYGGEIIIHSKEKDVSPDDHGTEICLYFLKS